MEFKARVFIPKNISYWKRNTLSEKISDLSALFLILVGLIHYVFFMIEMIFLYQKQFLAQQYYCLF